MELKCQSAITTSRVKIESLKGMVQEAALAIPDEKGKLEPRQVTKLLAYYKTFTHMEERSQPIAQLSYVDCNIDYPDSYQRKKVCLNIDFSKFDTFQE